MTYGERSNRLLVDEIGPEMAAAMLNVPKVTS
jgi:hypothetical protein